MVLDDHLRDEQAEWRDFGTVEDVARGNVPGKRARCGDVGVDESRWVGGLMSTTVGREPYTSASASSSGSNVEERQKLASLRQRLKRTHNMIENMLEKEHKERYREVVLEEQARMAKVARGEQQEGLGTTTTTTTTTTMNALEFEETSVRVKGDYEGLMAAEQQQQMNHSHSTIANTSLLNSKTNEMYMVLNNNKWSLTHAILLYGTIQQVQQYAGDYHGSSSNYNNNNNNNSSTTTDENYWTHPTTLETERRTLHKKLDVTTRSSMHKLYVAFALLEKASRALGFHGIANGTFREAISWLVKFGSVRGDLKVGGIKSRSGRKKNGERQFLDEENDCSSSERLVLSLFAGTDELEHLFQKSGGTSKKSSSSTVWNELHRLKQYASLGAAILYISAKRTGVGRTLVEVCSAFGTFAVVNTGGSRSDKRYNDDDMESLVRPKDCSKAMEELKQAVPDVLLSPVEKAVALSSKPQPSVVPSSCPSANSAKQGLLSSQPLESIARVTPDYLPSDMSTTIMKNTNAEESALADLTSRMASSLNLPPSAAVAAIAVSTQCKRDNSTSQQTPKYIRPRQRKSKSAIKNDSDELIAAASLLLVSTAGGIMQRLAEQALSNAQTSSEAQVDTFTSWSEWNSQPSWHREVSNLEECTGLPSKNILACYSNNLHPRRAHLLGAVKRKFELGEDEGDKCLQNIAVAAPLMSLKH